MKYILVVANNKAEWNHFCTTLEWKCSKQNTVYKRVAEAFCDIDALIMYHVVYNNTNMREYQGGEYDDYVLLCNENNVDMELLLGYIKGE